MIIFWLSQDSNVTPPVCLAAFTAAAIAKSPPMATGVTSWKLAKGLYIVPVLFAYTPLLTGDWGEALTIFGFAVVGIYALAAGLQGCMEHPLGWPLRAVALAAGLACLWPHSIPLNARRRRRHHPAPCPEHPQRARYRPGLTAALRLPISTAQAEGACRSLAQATVKPSHSDHIIRNPAECGPRQCEPRSISAPSALRGM